ncbi:sensor histidine kinase [Bacillaceae bacterium SIJ1]|uniref:sensor histidine kinase n=1 Tax=Litoribacterium kuwaitense TaxID=1398745 RepID=UPI0013ED8EAF|nr:sensor histidine kinase [Litoribacterium kuwaitense]NGP45594.1 sensor histidine kinase [Litoribacterium kuwaitense]
MEKQHSRVIDTILFVSLFFLTLALFYNPPEHQLIMGGAAFLFSIIQFVRYRLLKLEISTFLGGALLSIQWGLAVLIQVIDGTFLPQIFFFILIAELAFTVPQHVSLSFAIWCYGSFVFGVAVHHQFPPFEKINFVVPRILEYALIWGFSYIAKTVIDQRNQLDHAYGKLKENAMKLEEKTLLEERMRLSRDVHDTVGHTLTAAIFGIETSKQKFSQNDHEQGIKHLGHVQEQMRASLQQIRQYIHTLYEQKSFLHFENSLRQLLKDTEESSGVEIDAAIYDIPPLTPAQELTVYRALQEGLTNGIKHGKSRSFQFVLRGVNENLHFQLDNDGTSPARIQYGFGLSTMEERIQALCGKLQLQIRPTGGMRLSFSLPLTEEQSYRKEGEHACDKNPHCRRSTNDS